ncbi:MFS transporter [Labilibaculum antarcticum]|uniref:MFS transporter n=1 Tax=Labilibaculum antarcticum TaxID=1717717 RepID=A0A1Y1CLP0_9BACT|nr:MFS transporter [Labilibaculum antarcticum]BAX81316.1 MFS transporter [Labilibaculum antarcticum]
MKKQPRLSFWQIWNLSFGFLGVQFGFALQNANASRILSNLGADLHSLSLFWLVAPVMGLLIQPVVGAASDKTWTRLGRRTPYILGGAIFSMIAMFFMPNAPNVISAGGIGALLFGAVMLAVMDGSFNVTFQPFRALVADMTPEEQRNVGYSVQSFLINVGAVIGSALPFILTAFGVQNDAPAGEVADSVIWSFYLGGSILLLSVLVTVFKTKEHPPAEFEAYNNITAEDKEKNESIFSLLKNLPTTMKQLALVQLLSWFPLFLMWVYATPAIAQHYWNTPIGDASSPAYNEAANWVGICFAAYSLFAALFSIIMPWFIRKTSRKFVYSFALVFGGLGYISTYFFHDQYMLLVSMVGIGFAWAAILAMPYAILSGVLPAKSMGVYMGLFNLTVVIPQIISGVFGGTILKVFFQEQAIYILVLCGVLMLFGSVSVFFIKTQEDSKL